MVEIDIEENDNLTDDIYYDTDYEDYSPTSGFCSFIESNLGLGWLWWLVVLIQLAVLPVIILIQRLCILLPVLNFIHISSIITFYLNTSLWIWTVYLITASAQCGTGLENPLLTSALILVSALLACSILDCVLSREGWYLLDLKHMADADTYFEKIQSSPPMARVNIECFHTNTVSTLGMRGGIFTRTEKVVTFTDHMDLPLTGWKDLTVWPTLEDIASEGAIIIGISFEKEVEAEDEKTKKALEKFRNKFVEQNCHKDNEIRTWLTCSIPALGEDQSLFITTREKSETPVAFKIGFFLFLSSLCLSCPLKMFIRKKTKLIPLKVSKVYSYDPGKTSPLPPLPGTEPKNAEEPVNEDYLKKPEDDKLNILNEDTSVESLKNSNDPSNEKVLLDAALTVHETNNEMKMKAVSQENETIPEPAENPPTERPPTQQMVLMSPLYGQKTVLLSPVYQTSGESRFVIIPVDMAGPSQDSCRAVQLQNTADRQTAELARQIREKLLARQKLLDTARIIRNVMEEPVKICKESALQHKMCLDHSWSLPSIQYLRDMQSNHPSGEYYNNQSSIKGKDSTSQTVLPTSTTSIHFDLPGRDYYDQSLYDQRNHPSISQPPLSLQNNLHEEERLRNALHPRVAMLKNTNIEKDKRARQVSVTLPHSKRVHYSDVDEYDMRSDHGVRDNHKRHHDVRMADDDDKPLSPSRRMDHGGLSPSRQMEYGRMSPSRRMDYDSHSRMENDMISPSRKMDYGRMSPNRQMDYGRMSPNGQMDYGRLSPNRQMDYGRMSPGREMEYGRISPGKKMASVKTHVGYIDGEDSSSPEYQRYQSPSPGTMSRYGEDGREHRSRREGSRGLEYGEGEDEFNA